MFSGNCNDFFSLCFAGNVLISSIAFCIVFNPVGSNGCVTYSAKELFTVKGHRSITYIKKQRPETRQGNRVKPTVSIQLMFDICQKDVTELLFSVCRQWNRYHSTNKPMTKKTKLLVAY